MIRRVIRHRSVQSSACTAVTLGALSTFTRLPWPLWAVWATLSVMSVRQALRSEQPAPARD